MKYILSLLGAFIMGISILLSIFWYDWHLPLVIFLFIAGNNIEKRFNK
jgi:hypothetical protein